MMRRRKQIATLSIVRNAAAAVLFLASYFITVSAQENDGSGATASIAATAIDYSGCDESVPNYPYDCVELRAPIGATPEKRLGHCHGSCTSIEDCKPDFLCVATGTGSTDASGTQEQLLRRHGCGGVLQPGVNYCVDQSMVLDDEGFDSFNAFMMAEVAGGVGADTGTGQEETPTVAVADQEESEEPAPPINDGSIPNLEFVGQFGPFGLCQGDCDKDRDCIGDLVCFERDGTDNDVPGCAGDQAGDDVDYCINPNTIQEQPVQQEEVLVEEELQVEVEGNPVEVQPETEAELEPELEDQFSVGEDKLEPEEEQEDVMEEEQAQSQPETTQENIDDIVVQPEPEQQPSSTSTSSTSTCVEGYGCLKYVSDGKNDDFGLSHCEGSCSSGSDCAGELKCVQRILDGDKFEPNLRKFGCAGDIQDGVDYCVDTTKKLEGFDLIQFMEASAPTTATPTRSPTMAPVTAVPTFFPTTSAPTTATPTTKPTENPTEHPTMISEVRYKPRRWTDLVTDDALDKLVIKDVEYHPASPKMLTIAIERDPFYFTEEPSVMPSAHPTNFPTFSPTPYNPYPYNKPPTDPFPDYFDYSVDGTDFSSGRGPNNWGELPNGIETREGAYWNEFDKYIHHDIVTNRCASGSNRQSPIDVNHKVATSQCFEFHQIRHKDGDFGVENPNVEKQILPSKLRLVYPRDGFPSGDVSFREQGGKVVPFGPSADMPKRWGFQLPVTHVDIKFPSEHWLEGKQYPMEYQINLIQNRLEKRRGAPIVSVMFDIHPKDKDSDHMEELIEQFEKVWKKDMQECEDSRRRQRRLDAKLLILFAKDEQKKDINTWLDEPEEEEMKFQSNLRTARRRAQDVKYSKWDPWHESIVRSVWFYGYEGSLTEPPCSEFVEWRIILEPALISKRQLERLKNVLFNHVDENCQRTSVHSKEYGVARPLQPYNGHTLYTCTCMDFMDDESKDAGIKKCRFRDREKYGFPEDIYTEEWYEETHKWESIEQLWANTGDGTQPWWA